jgi:putative methionine-R-sulfoxide reductase with GAF domain
MKKLFASLALGAALIAGPAIAGTMDNTYENTIVVTYANGSQALYHFNADGTFTGVAPGGSTMAGNYTAEGDQLCLIPPSGAAPQCTTIATDKNVGETWTQNAADGSEISVELRAGR